MAIKPSQLQTILYDKRQDFEGFARGQQTNLERYQSAWQALCETEAADLDPWLNSRHGNIGARPLENLESNSHGICPSGLQWDNREHSLQWVNEHLTGITTFAVDGSQIFPSKDLSPPIALVQIGWFENPHTSAADYIKDIQLDVMTPKDLELGDTSKPLDRLVNKHRFKMEVGRLVKYIETVQAPESCLVFFDGALVATFADAYEDEDRKEYVDALVTLLEASETHRVPLVGYVDTSSAHDLTTLLEHHSASVSMIPKVTDAQMLNRYMQWGDCTAIFQCDRQGILTEYKQHKERVIFTYLKTNQGYPARIEMPRWMHEAGITDRVLNWVRAETIVGGGYPYAIETADQTAVLQTSDRQIFFRILQDWASHEELQLRWSRKMMSKLRRR
ncbi:DNA double-strand break repair nuclease NurA [Leptothoe kymatousa]|uniref:DNA double-strand break repair nuclease NurA n=1 Tax=Leptothoe kymatousa TAU-MAC 1615 TaxID=2364775 RepID=A0ABS5Y5I6_9CYAN|nr:DNA double-strand break repair nuclease NurA [Leptothoe kymatousa]MBT9313107.1 DNA double-strand break repair nuclease NurA [Leptothoe kymatousa TAU-MAC 1615]